jgi:phosphate transport system substrate-binding protein
VKYRASARSSSETLHASRFTFHVSREGFILCGLIALVLRSSACLAADEPVVVIVNRSNPVISLTLSELARIYKGEVTEWPNGDSITVINRPIESDLRRMFYHLVLHVRPTQKYFQTGSPIPFETVRVDSEQSIARFVSRLPSAIAYCYRSAVDDSVKIVKISGLSPEAQEYQLK